MQNIQPSSYKSPTPRTWLLSFVDLLSLILTFFVLLYSMSATKEPKWNEVKESLIKRLNPDKEAHDLLLTADKTIPLVKIKTAFSPHYLFSIIQEKISAEQELAALPISLQDDSVVISLPQSTLFIKGKEQLTPEALYILALLEDIFHQIGNRVDVHGYADTGSGGRYPSHWELSLARAISVARGLQKSGYDYEIQTFGSVRTAQQKNTSADKKALYDFSHSVDIVIRKEKAGNVKTGGNP